MTNHSVAFLEAGGSRLPPLLNTGLKYLIRTRKMIPHGDRRDRAESGRTEY
jgi:hypothetical protein